ncbi:MAG: 6,7-dimethyl-8-ribityllumazine synthase [Ginsengibacter sp.]
MAITEDNLFDINPGILQKDAFIIIVRTRWNSAIVDKLQAGCIKVFEHFQMKNYRVVTVPGAFEIPFAISSFWNNSKLQKPKAFIALGCVLRGDTPHFDYVCKAVTDGVMQLNLALPVPTIFGVLTVDNQQQADDRTGGRLGNKGEESAMSALQMITLQQEFYSGK